MKDQDFSRKFKDYFIEALGLLTKESNNEKEIPVTIDQDVDFGEKNEQGKYTKFSFPNKSRKAYSRFVLQRYDLLKELNSYKACLQYLKDKKYVQDSMEEQGFFINTIVDFIKHTNGLQFNENKFEEIYKGISDYVSNDLVKFSCSAQIFGFESDVDELIIDESVSIRKYSEAECKEDWQHSRFFGSRMFILNPSDFKLEIIFSKKKEYLRHHAGEGQTELKNALTLLRLFKSSTVRIGPIQIKPAQWVPFGGITIAGIDERHGGSYHLNIGELLELRKLWSDIKAINLTNVYPLEIALKRFNFAHERSGLEDKLIDIMIGFETLYSDSNTEIRYKISLRTAILIGNNLEERKIIFKVMQEAYLKRSDLVHGRKLEDRISVSKPVNKEFRMHEFVDLIKNYLSDSIKSFIKLSRNKNHKQIINELHEFSLTVGIK